MGGRASWRDYAPGSTLAVKGALSVAHPDAQAAPMLSRDLHPEPFVVRWRRRLIVYAVFLAVTALFLLALPLLLLLALALDLRGKRNWVNLRVLVFFSGYLFFYWAALARLAVDWLVCRSWAPGFRDRLARRTERVGVWWTSGLFAMAMRVFHMRVEVDGAPLLDHGPMIVFMRHASLPDTLLAIWLIMVPYGIRVRHVVKRENLWDPCVDLGLHRWPNVFIERNPKDTDHEIRILVPVMEELDANEAVAMFPEGTRFAPEKRERRLAMIKERHPEIYAEAAALRNVLPPRPAGTLALLETNEQIGADAVFCAHAGFERVLHTRDFLKGSLLAATIQVKLWRVPFAEIPKDHDGRLRWLYEWWRRIDEWIGEQIR
jgi:1-acyl-sn-glycerol-3-phosphate acyltransferase